ncbi:MAG: HAMP domain-containing sensor histidine kinase [Bacteroidota bacterium]
MNKDLLTNITSNADELHRKNEELRKVNDQLDGFVYSCYHDLKGPIATLMGLINLTKMEKECDKLDWHIEMIRKSIVKLDQRVNDIISFSKNSRLEIKKEEVDIQRMILGILEKYISTDEYKHISSLVEIDQRYTALCDITRLEIIFNNLILNALQYADRSKYHCYLSVTGEVTSEKIVLHFRDNGIGIHNSLLDKVFNMFYRGSDRSIGVGLGLYVAKESVAKLNGTIEVDSTVGIGSNFTVSLPNKSSN